MVLLYRYVVGDAVSGLRSEEHLVYYEIAIMAYVLFQECVPSWWVDLMAEDSQPLYRYLLSCPSAHVVRSICVLLYWYFCCIITSKYTPRGIGMYSYIDCLTKSLLTSSSNFLGLQ